jgi:hypothetical protein
MPRALPLSTTPILPSEFLLLDDRALFALSVGERLPIGSDGRRFTTSYCYFRASRASRAMVAGVGGHLSGPFERPDADRRAVALEHLLELPEDVGLPDPRRTVPVMVDVQRRHPHLNVLDTEAAVAALLLGAKMALSSPTAGGQPRSVLPIEHIAFQTVDLP